MDRTEFEKKVERFRVRLNMTSRVSPERDVYAFVYRRLKLYDELVKIAKQALHLEKGLSQDMDGEGDWSTTVFEVQIEDVLSRAEEDV